MIDNNNMIKLIGQKSYYSIVTQVCILNFDPN